MNVFFGLGEGEANAFILYELHEIHLTLFNYCRPTTRGTLNVILWSFSSAKFSRINSAVRKDTYASFFINETIQEVLKITIFIAIITVFYRAAQERNTSCFI